jgi:hypothetical protein
MLVPRLYVGATTLILLIAGGHRLLMVDSGVPTHWPSAMRFTTKCLTSTTSLTQIFRVTADAVSGVTVLPSMTPGTSGQMLVELREGQKPGGAVRHKAVLPLADLTTDRAFTITTPRIPAPADGGFTLWIGRSEDTGCLAFHASATSVPDAHLAIADREQFGDLLFQVHADRGTALHALQTWLTKATGVTVPTTVIAVLAFIYLLSIGALCWQLILAGTDGASVSARAGVTEPSGPVAG